MVTIRQQCLVWDNIFFRRMCIQYAMGPFVANQNHSCKTIQVFEWLHIRKTEWVILCQYMHGSSSCHDWMAFWFHYLNQTSRFWMWVCIESTEKWLVENCPLNLTIHRMWSKLSTTLKYMPLTHYCSPSSVRRWTQNTHVFSPTKKWDGVLASAAHILKLEVRWLSKGRSLDRVFALLEPLQRFLSEKQSPVAAHFNDTEWVTKLAYLCDIFNSLTNSICHLGENDNCVQVSNKVAVFKIKLELWGTKWTLRFLTFQTLAEIERDRARAFILQAGAWSPISAFKSVWALLPNHKGPPNWEGMDPWPICE